MARAHDYLRDMRGGAVFAIVGPAGVGKSSFLHAGLLPELSRDARHFVVLEPMRPQLQPLTGAQGLAAALHATRARFGLTEPSLGEIKAGLLAGSSGIRMWLTEIAQAAKTEQSDYPWEAPPTLVLPIDQAEELLDPDAGNQGRRVLELLADALTHTTDGSRRLALTVVLTLRTAAFEAMRAAKALAGIETLVFDDFAVTRELLAAAITGPARRAGVTFETALVEQLLNDCGERADALPLLALMLARLHQDHTPSSPITCDDYAALGGIAGIVERSVGGALARDPRERRRELALLQRVFVPWLVTVDAEGRPVRRLVAWVDLPADAYQALNRFIAAGLLLAGERNGQFFVEVACDVLLREWGELARWLLEYTENLEAQELTDIAEQWRQAEGDHSLLLRGVRLRAAETLATDPNYRGRLAGIGDFLGASRFREDDRFVAETVRRQADLESARENVTGLSGQVRKVSVVAIVAVLVALGTSLGAWQQASSARGADARARQAVASRLVTDAQAILSGSRSGGDVRALQQILAAHALAPGLSAANAVTGAVYDRMNVDHVIETRNVVSAVAFSPDGSRIASGGYDHTVRLWNAVTGKQIGQPMAGHTDTVGSVAFSPDGTRLASAATDGTIRLWDVRTGQQIGPPLTGHSRWVASVAFSPDGARLVSGSGDGTIRLWNAGTGAPLGPPLTGHTDAVETVAFSPDGTRIASGGYDHTIRLWDVATGAPVGMPMTGHGNWVVSVAFSPDGSRLASGSSDSTVRLWNVATQTEIGGPISADSSGVASVAFSPDGSRLASGGADGAIRVWNAATGSRLTTLTGHANWVSSVMFSPDGSRLVSGSADRTVRVWNTADGQPMGRPLVGHTDVVGSAAFSPNGSRIVSGGHDHTIRIWDAASGMEIGPPLVGHTDWVASVAYSPDGSRIVSGGADGTVRLWDATNGLEIGGPLAGHTGWVMSVAFSPDGSRIVSGSYDHTVRVWSAVSGVPLVGPIVGHTAEVRGVAFSPDSTRVASASLDGTVRLWDAATGAPVGQPLLGHTDVMGVAFSRNGSRIVSGGDHTLRVWNAHTGSALGAPLIGHTDVVSGVAFSPDGSRVVSSSYDHTVRLWDVGTGSEIGPPLVGHTDAVMSVAFSPDGSRIVSAGRDGIVRTWPNITATDADLCAKLSTNMSRRQWSDWVSDSVGYIAVCPGLPPADDGD